MDLYQQQLVETNAILNALLPVMPTAFLPSCHASWQHAYPDLDPGSVRQQLDDLAAEVEAGLPEGVRYPLRVIQEINRVLYQVGGIWISPVSLL